MRQSRVKKRWAQGKPVLGTVAHFSDPSSAELIGLMGFDCLWIDLEHQPLSMADANHMIRAARVADMDVMARPAKGEFMRMARLIEAGASLIMYPRCESAAEARELVRCGKFPPLGERGFFSASADNPYSTMPAKDYVKQANEQTTLIAQIESPNAVKHAAAIAAVDGIDMLFFGPGDFSVISGVPGEILSPVVQAGLEETARVALAAGKRFGTIVPDLEYTKRMLDLGASLLCYGGDLHFVRQALADVRTRFGPLGFEFEPKLGHDRIGPATV
ncbi:MAG: HpcH/HpaI aldolase family protein [Bryobacteraceae bacterium]